jgi:tetratricopeptide (TPR) repeat protein
LFLTAVLIAFASAPLFGDELRAAVDKFLETGAIPSPANVSQAAEQYRQLRAQAPEDARVEYACAIVLLNQRRYANALPLLARHVAQRPDDLDAAGWHVWALVQCRRYREALSAIDQLSKRFEDRRVIPDDVRNKTLLTMGGILGYCERVRPGGVSTDDVLKAKNSLLARLAPVEIEVLDQGTALTSVKFDELIAARQQRLADRAASSEEARDQIAESLAVQNAQAAQSESEREAKAAESKDAVRQWTVLRTQIASLTQDRARVSAQLMTVQAMLQQLSTTIDLGTTGSGPNAQPFRRQTFRLEDAFRAQQYAMQIASLNRQAFAMDRKLLEYGRQAETLRAAGATQGDAAIRSEELRQDAQKRAAQLDKRLRQLEREKPANAATMTSQMRSLSTYLPFDYEGERTRVLSWFD